MKTLFSALVAAVALAITGAPVMAMPMTSTPCSVNDISPYAESCFGYSGVITADVIEAEMGVTNAALIQKYDADTNSFELPVPPGTGMLVGGFPGSTVGAQFNVGVDFLLAGYGLVVAVKAGPESWAYDIDLIRNGSGYAIVLQDIFSPNGKDVSHIAGFRYNPSASPPPDPNDPPTQVPEPAALALMGAGLVGLVGMTRRRTG